MVKKIEKKLLSKLLEFLFSATLVVWVVYLLALGIMKLAKLIWG